MNIMDILILLPVYESRPVLGPFALPGFVRPKSLFALIIKKYFNEHNAYFNLNCNYLRQYIDLNESVISLRLRFRRNFLSVSTS